MDSVSESLLPRTRNDFPEDEEFAKLVNQIEEAIEAGVYPERNPKGSSGSYLAKSQEGNTIGIFKPKDEEPYAPKNPKWIKWFQKQFLSCCFGRDFLLSNQGYLSEAACTIVDQKLGLNIVPKTHVVWLSSPTFNYKSVIKSNAKSSDFHKKISLPSKIGSLQTIVDGYKDSSSFINDFDMKKASEEIKQDFQLQFERLVLLDYIIRNTDRGADNWLIKIIEADSCKSQNSEDPSTSNEIRSISSNPKKSKIKIAAIDNGLAFPYKHPHCLRPYSFGWEKLNQAKIPFSDEICDMLLPRLENANFIDQLCENLKELFQLDDDFNDDKFEKQMAVMRGQIFNVIKTLKEKKSPSELVKL